MIITEADRATARRVIRRHMGATPHAKVFVARGLHSDVAWFAPGASIYCREEPVAVTEDAFGAACLAAAQGREYAKALRGAR